MDRRQRRLLATAVLMGLPGLGAAQNSPIDVLNRFTSSASQQEVARAIGTLCPAGNRVSARLQQDCNALVGAAFGGESTVRGAIAGITPDSARIAVDRAQLQGTPMRSSAATRSLGAGGFAGSGLLAAPDWWLAASAGQVDAGADFGPWGLYATLESRRNERDASLNQDGYDDDGQSLLIGVDRRLGAGWSLGFSLGLARSDADYTGNSGNHESEDSSLNLHAAWSGEGGWYADTLLSVGHRQTTQARRTQYATAGGGAVNQTYRARFDTTTRRYALTLGHRFDRGTWAIDPYLQLEQRYSDVDAYDEVASAPDAPGGGWAVSVERQQERQLHGTLGLRASWVISGESGVFLPYLDLGLVRQLDADEADAFVRYTGDRSDAVGLSRLRFAMRADAEDDTWGRVAVGVAAQFARGRAGFLRYVQNFGEDRYARREVQLGGRFEF